MDCSKINIGDKVIFIREHSFDETYTFGVAIIKKINSSRTVFEFDDGYLMRGLFPEEVFPYSDELLNKLTAIENEYMEAYHKYIDAMNKIVICE